MKTERRSPRAVLLRHYNFTEQQKGISGGLPIQLLIASGQRQVQATGTELSQLQMTANPQRIHGKLMAPYEIFCHVGSTKIGEVVEALPYLRKHGSDSVRLWLERVNQSLHQVILGRNCPAIMTLTTRFFNCGDIPDGNHRALAAVELHNTNFTGTLDRYIIETPVVQSTILNWILTLHSFRSNPSGTLKVLRERRRGTV